VLEFLSKISYYYYFLFPPFLMFSCIDWRWNNAQCPFTNPNGGLRSSLDYIQTNYGGRLFASNSALVNVDGCSSTLASGKITGLDVRNSIDVGLFVGDTHSYPNLGRNVGACSLLSVNSFNNTLVGIKVNTLPGSKTQT
jgi:hypothetical protein